MPELEDPSVVDPISGAVTAESGRALPQQRIKVGAPNLVQSAADYEALPQGMRYRDPEGVPRTKPFKIEDDADYWNVPEGAEYIDPSGERRRRPVYQSVGVTTQTLYDMAANDSERRRVLERGYPKGAIKDSPAGLYVEDEGGVLRKPGRGVTGAVGHTLAEAAPLGGMLAGSVIGGGAGLAGGPAAPATVPGGAIAGGVMGAMMGRQFNNIILGIAGVHDRTLMQDVGSMGWEGATVAGGEVAGRAIGAALPLAGHGIDVAEASIKDRAGQVAAYLTGVYKTPEAARMARNLAKQDVAVRPSAYMPEAPYLATAAEVFDPKFRAQNVLRESARSHYEKQAAGLADTLGFDVPAGGFTRAEAGVSYERAGRAAQEAAAMRLARSDAELDAQIAGIERGAAERTAAAEAGFAERQAAVEAERVRLDALAASNRADADALINQGFNQIEREIEQGLRSANAASNSGDLWQAAARKFRELNAAIKARAGVMYGRGDAVAGHYIPPQDDLAGRARALLNTLPKDFHDRYPHIAQQLRDLAGVFDEETGELLKEPVQLTLGQLRHLRSSLGQEVDWSDLSAGIREGVYKHFRTGVDQIIKNPELPPEALRAVAFYNEGDRIYAKNMPIYRSRTVKAVMRGIESGYPADATALADTLIKEGFTEQIAKVKRMVGPNLWAAVAAADKRNIMNVAKTLREGEVDAVAFAREIVRRNKAGLLAPVHGRDGSAALVRQAEAIMQLEGELPVRVRPGDSLTSVIEQAHAAKAAAESAAKADPLRVLEREVATIKAEADAAIKAARAGASARFEADPFKFLVDPGVGAIEAAKKILDTPDLLIAAAARFGENSETFTLLRQVAALRILTQPIETVGRAGVRTIRQMDPKVWNLIFPGVTQKQAATLAREMEFLLGPRPDVRGPGSSIAAQSRVLNPWGAITGGGELMEVSKLIPGGNAAGRLALTKYYQLMSWASSNPATVLWLTNALERGDPGMRQYAWEVVFRAAKERGGLVGRAAAQTAAGTPELEQGQPGQEE